MTANPNRKSSLNDVLTQLAALPKPPDAPQLSFWMGQYPEFKSEIIDFVTDWIEVDATEATHDVTQDDIDLVVNRTMSRVQQLLDEAEQTASVKDLIGEIHAAGHDLQSFQESVGLDRSMLNCLAERMVRPATIPKRLILSLAETLNRNMASVRNFFRLPPKPSAAYKARKRPEAQQVDFAFIVKHADLPDSEKARWLAEPTDPILRE